MLNNQKIPTNQVKDERQAEYLRSAAAPLRIRPSVAPIRGAQRRRARSSRALIREDSRGEGKKGRSKAERRGQVGEEHQDAELPVGGPLSPVIIEY